MIVETAFAMPDLEVAQKKNLMILLSLQISQPLLCNNLNLAGKLLSDAKKKLS